MALTTVKMSKAVKFILTFLLLAVALQYFIGSQLLFGFLKHFFKPRSTAAQKCIVSNCLKPAIGCFADYSCVKTLGCIQKCGITRDQI